MLAQNISTIYKMLLFVVLLCFAAISRSVASPFGPRIISGQNATLGQFPWQVELEVISLDLTSYYCTGSLISEEWILTAAHCIANASLIRVYSGIVNLSSTNQVRTVIDNYTVHEDYDSVLFRNDIGLIYLEIPLTFDDTTTAITLSEEEVLSGINVTISGWGDVEAIASAGQSPLLQYATVTTIDNDECADIYGIFFPNVICAIGREPIRNPCFGDGGAPLIANLDTNATQVGIFSFVSSLGCDQDYPAGYTRIQSFRGWIRAKTGI